MFIAVKSCFLSESERTVNCYFDSQTTDVLDYCLSILIYSISKHNASDAEMDSLRYNWDEPLDDFVGAYNPPITPAPVLFAAGYTYNITQAQLINRSLNTVKLSLRRRPIYFQIMF